MNIALINEVDIPAATRERVSKYEGIWTHIQSLTPGRALMLTDLTAGQRNAIVALSKRRGKQVTATASGNKTYLKLVGDHTGGPTPTPASAAAVPPRATARKK